MSLNPQLSHLNRLKALTPRLRMQTGTDFFQWQSASRKALEAMLGLPFESCDPNFRIEQTVDHGTFLEHCFLFESEEDVTVSGHLLLPKDAEKVPLVICLQGHNTGCHISLGIEKVPGDIPTEGDRNFAQQIIARGQAALVLEQRGFGQRGGNPRPVCDQPAAQALLLGRTLVGERCWDVSRAIDVIPARFPQINTEKIAVMGNSGGGTVSLYVAALDQRIAACMPCCAFSSYHASIGVRLHCACNYIPGIAAAFDMGDVAGLIAPRPLVVVTGEHDRLFPAEAARAQMEIARTLYRCAGAEGMARHVVGPEGHRFYADLSWPAFDEVTNWPHK